VAIEDLWYKNAIIYCLPVEKYMDTNGDGVGDFEGLSRRLDYLAGLGVTCVWLQPFYASPGRDNGYDVSDYYQVDQRFGSSGDFVDLMNHARANGMRVIVDLVVNHTSIEHPWFRAARQGIDAPFRDWYVWSESRPSDHATGTVFPGVQETTWTRDEVSGAYYFHRFYNFQPDLNTWHPAVREEIRKVMGYWLQLGISGFRMDAVPFLIERKGAGVDHVKDFDLLHEMRQFLQWRCRDAVLLAEANVPPGESLQYFGDEGSRIQMMLNFPVNQRLFYALATGDVGPLGWALEQTRRRPADAQWVHFLRSHDELDLGRLSEDERTQVFQAFGPEPSMQLYDRGIRRRLAPMLGNDRRRLELAFSLLFSLPGTPMMQYGDEIGMGDDLSLPERECARTPMQWTDEPFGGFTRSRRPVAPPITGGEYGWERVNVASQLRDPDSLLNWTERRIRMRKQCPEISWGDYTLVRTNVPEALVLRYDWRGTSLVTVHHFADKAARMALQVGGANGRHLVDIFSDTDSEADASGTHHLELRPYDYRWYRVGAADNALDRADR
jgi:maltose alpha-D-glucosyltransferase/alpha-amylase